MGVGDEIKSGSFSIYAQWMGFVSCFVLGSLGAFNMISFQDFAWVGLVAILLAVVTFLVELPWFGHKLPEKGQSIYQHVGFRVGYYFVLTALSAVAGVFEVNLYFIPTGLLGLTMLLYVVALIRKQPLERSCISQWVGMGAMAIGLGV